MAEINAPTASKTRIQNENREIILQAALEVFSTYGYRGATVDQIAAKCSLSKPNLLYYFRRKEDIYTAVLEKTLSEWLVPLRLLDIDAEPISELTRYIEAKLEMSFANPVASKLFANEILHGAPHVEKFLKGPMKELLEAKMLVINHWVKQNKINPVEPRHFIYAIWAVTQHYADFAAQISTLSEEKITLASTNAAVLDILLRGLKRA